MSSSTLSSISFIFALLLLLSYSTPTDAAPSLMSASTSRQEVPPFITPSASPDADMTAEPSPDASGEPDDGDDDEICVEHTYLASYAAHHLVHGNRPITATVLCATSHPSLPCMTRHHMVRVAGTEMSMREFCATEHATCEERRNVQVNSVLSHMWKDEVHHKDVELTMFDARHPKTAQRMLHRAIAMKRRVW